MARDRQHLRPLGGPTVGARGKAAADDAVTRLQRAAGNRGFRQLLREPAPLLGGVDADTRKHVQIATTNVPFDFTEESFDRADPKQLKGYEVKYGDKVPEDANLRKGLKVIAWDMLDPDGHKEKFESPFRDNSTVTLELNLKQFKGKDGLWQFTVVGDGKAAKHRLLIDYMGPATQLPEGNATRFGQLGMSTKSGAAAFSPTEKDAIYAAVDLLPAAAAAALPQGLTFIRDHKPTGAAIPPNAAGVYLSSHNTITLFDRWKDSQVRYARAAPQVATVLHELGHALDHAMNLDAGLAAALAKDGGTAISGYGSKDKLESFAEIFFLYVADPKELEALRPHVYAFMQAKFAAAPPARPAPAAATSAPAATPPRRK